MDSKDDCTPSSSGFPMQYIPSYHSGRRLLPPLGATDPHHAFAHLPFFYITAVLPFFQSTCPLHILAIAFFTSFFSHPPPAGASGLLPSVSQSHVPSIPPELRTKGGPRRYEAIFVGYKDNRIGWRVRDLAGRYHFSRDVVFNETVPGHLSPNRGLPLNLSLLPPPSQLPHPSSSEPPADILNPHTSPTPLPSPSITDVVHTRNLLSRVTRSTTNSLPKPSRHYNDILFR